MAIDSAAWTGREEASPTAPPGAPQVCGEFHGKEAMEEAIMRLAGSVFDRSQISVRVPGQEDSSSYSSQENPVQEDDARNLRTLGTSTAGAALGMAAAGAVIATGGAALPAIAAAAAAAGATVVAGEVAGASATSDGKTEQQHAADESAGVIVMVSADTEERQAKAEEILRGAGATRVWRQDSP